MLRRTFVTGLAVLALAAVTPAAQADPGKEAPAGAYWHSRTLFTMTHPRQVGTGTDKYWVVERRLSETTAARDGRIWSGFRRLGAEPKSAADRAAWKRDGSPAKWSYRTEGMLVELSTAPDKGSLVPAKPAGFILATRKVTFEELQALPSEPGALKEWLVESRMKGEEPPARREDVKVAGTLVELLHSYPVPKRVRQAAFTLLSAEPGYTVTDLGRSRKKLSETSRSTKSGKQPAIVAKHTITVDTSDMLIVARTLDSTIDGKPFPDKTWTMVIESGWSAAAPAVPAE